MPGKIYLDLLILCGIWSQGIIGAFAHENIRESSSFRVRQKRVISYEPGEDRQVRIEDHPYIVNIKLHNRVFCMGTILSHRAIITAAECAQYDKTEYIVVSGTSRSNSIIVPHIVTEIKLHYGNHPNRTSEGIALLIINPTIVYSVKSKKIDLHGGAVLPGMIGTVSGWGYNSGNISDPGTQFPLELRSIQVPIMVHEECVKSYRLLYRIFYQDICTFHPLKRTGHNDAGAPLVIDNMLVGIFLRRGLSRNSVHTEYPDVFAYVQHPYYRRWIMANI